MEMSNMAGIPGWFFKASVQLPPTNFSDTVLRLVLPMGAEGFYHEKFRCITLRQTPIVHFACGDRQAREEAFKNMLLWMMNLPFEDTTMREVLYVPRYQMSNAKLEIFR